MTPLKGPRDLVKIPQITTMRDDDGDGTKEKVPVVVEMKRGIREFFKLDRIPTDDPLLYGTNSTTNKQYRKRLGGFRHGSYKITFSGDVEIKEYEFTDSGWQESTRKMKSISFGLPTGHNTIQVLAFLENKLEGSAEADKLNKLVTPEGNSYPLNFSDTNTVPDTAAP